MTIEICGFDDTYRSCGFVSLVFSAAPVYLPATINHRAKPSDLNRVANIPSDTALPKAGVAA